MEVFVFIFGAIIGSFLNVCIHRIPNDESLVRPGSHCPHCKDKIPFYLNIPILSYLLLRGKCRACKIKIPFRYPLIELLSALVTLLAFYRFGLSPSLAFYLILSYGLIVIAMIDLKTKLIHNKILLFLLISAIIVNAIFQVVPWAQAGLGFLISGATMFLVSLLGKYLFKKESMGMGDVKFAAVVGFFMGWQMVLIAIYFGFVLALVAFYAARALPRKETDRYIPMGPYMALSLFIFLIWGNEIVQLYLDMVV